MIPAVLVSFAVMLLIGTPIAFVLGLAGLVALLTTSGRSLLLLVPQQIFSGMDSFVLMAIPFYCLAGELMNAVGISERIVKLANALVGHLKGGLGHVNCLDSVMFAGISGSAAADVAGLGTIIIPAMCIFRPNSSGDFGVFLASLKCSVPEPNFYSTPDPVLAIDGRVFQSPTAPSKY